MEPLIIDDYHKERGKYETNIIDDTCNDVMLCGSFGVC